MANSDGPGGHMTLGWIGAAEEERPPSSAIAVRVEGGDLADEVREAIRVRVEEHVNVALHQAAQASLSADAEVQRGVEPEIETVVSPKAAAAEGLTIGLQGVNLSQPERRQLVAEIQAMVGAHPVSCACTVWHYRNRIPLETVKDPQGNAIDPNAPPWWPVFRGPPGYNFWAFGVYFGGNYVARMELRDGAPFGVDQDHVDIGLGNDTAFDKEIWIHNYCRGITGSIAATAYSPVGPRFVIERGLCRAGAHEIVFRTQASAGPLGLVWFDIGYLELSRFWNFWSGTHVDFIWRCC